MYNLKDSIRKYDFFEHFKRTSFTHLIKGIVHFEIHFWYILAYLKGIRDVGVFVSAVVSNLIFLGQTVRVSII